MAEKRAAQRSSDAPSFEEALAELETIVLDLEEGKIPLAESLARYEAGVRLLKQCYELLEHAQRRIELLNRVDSDGNSQCDPFDDSAVSLEEKASQRGRRRSRGPETRTESGGDEIDGPGRLF